MTTIINLDNTFEDKSLTFSNWIDAAQCGTGVKNPRMSVGHKTMKNPTTPIPPKGKNYRDDTSYLYFLIKKAPCIGIYHSYPYIQGKTVERIPKNMKGYDLVIPLIGERDRSEPNESDELYQALFRFHGRVVKNICRNREGLPDFAQKFTDDKLAECIYPPYGKPGKNNAATWKPTWNIPFKYFKADPSKEKKESLMTRCKRPGGTFHPEELLSVKGKCQPGTVDAIIRVVHLGYSVKVEGGKTKLSISYNLELAELNFTPVTKGIGMNFLGDMAPTEEENAETAMYSNPVLKDIDENFGDDAPAVSPPKKSRRRHREDDD